MTTEDDPFSHLHKMSTTAGLGSGDYVAISGPAIACMLLGVASALVLFDASIFLILPALGLFCGVWGWISIAQSNGTQTGREIAVLGMLLSLGFGGYFTLNRTLSSMKTHANESQIVNLLHDLGSDLKEAGSQQAQADHPKAKQSDEERLDHLQKAEQAYHAAYELFDSDFHSKFPEPQFAGAWTHVNSNPYWGFISRIDWNKVLSFDVNPVDGSQQATGMILFYITKSNEPLRLSMGFRNDHGKWLVDQLPDFFAVQEKNTKQTGALGPPKPK